MDDGQVGAGSEWMNREPMNLSGPHNPCSPRGLGHLLISDELRQAIHLENRVDVKPPNNPIISLPWRKQKIQGPNQAQRLIIKDKWVSGPQTKLTGFERQEISFHH